MDPYKYTSGKNPPPRAPSATLQLKRWISENRDLVKRLVAMSGGDSPERAAKDFLRKWAGSWEKGLFLWSVGERPGREWWTDSPYYKEENAQFAEEFGLDQAELQE